MNKLFQNTAFNFGFWSGLCSFAFLNYLVYVITYNKYNKVTLINGQPVRFSGGGYWAGFPFDFYRVMEYSGGFSVVGLIANILVALIGSFVIGLVFKLVWSKIASRSLKLK